MAEEGAASEGKPFREIWRALIEEPVRGGARWSYVFGSGLALLFLLQVATGVVMAFHYSPSSQEAWGSVYFFQTRVTLGWFVRGLHHFGSSAMVCLLVLHMAQVFLFAAYRQPRQWGWWTGLALLVVTLTFSLTGYLLPWDQKGYWATRVVASITGSLPVFGSWLKALMQGGPDFGNLTLTRFFGFHVFILPASLFGVLLVHVWLFRRRGATPHWARAPQEIAARTEPFWPRQVTFDLAFFTLVVGALAALTIYNHGATLEAPADPGSSYLARPEWYFLWLFELLHFVPGRWEGLAMGALTLLGIAFLAGLPLIDRSPDPSLRGRRVHFLVAGAIATSVAALTVWPLVRDGRDAGVQMQRRTAEEAATRAFALAAQGIPPGGAEDLYLNDPIERGWRLFAVNCQACHKAHGKGGDSAPDLTGYLGRDWVRGVLAEPNVPRFYGRTKVNTMPNTEATPQELELLTDYVLSLGGATKEPPGGSDLFEEKGCQACHARADEDPRSAVSLGGYGSRAWMASAIKNAARPAYYGELNQMPIFEGKLTDAQIDDLLACLLSPVPPHDARR